MLTISILMHVIQEKYQSFFTPEEIEEARRRFEALGYFKSSEESR